MGCDIHSVAQVKVKGKHSYDDKWKTVLQDVAGDNRNYDTFAVLADVRNGFGFAGCDTGDGYIPMAEAKGLPVDFAVTGDFDHPIPKGTPTGDTMEWCDDKSENSKYKAERLKELAESENVWMGDHSHSWHTLAAIKAYIEKMASKRTVKRGFVKEAAYAALKGTNQRPESYCGGVGGPNVVTLKAREYEKLKADDALPNGEIYIQYGWKVDYTEATYLGEIVAQLEALAKQYKVNDTEVRMVFGFDS